MPKVYARRCPTARPAEKQTARSALEWGMQQTGRELSTLPSFPVEFIDIPAIECDIEVRPNNTANDYWEKPFHGHRRALLVELRDEWEKLETQIEEIDREFAQAAKREENCRRLLTIPGIGPLTATALTAAIGNAKAFHKSRDLAAWLGLVPRQHSTGDKSRLLGISKRGNPYLRRLLIHGGRAVVARVKREDHTFGSWLDHLEARSPRNTVVVATANKLARIAWAVLTRGQDYRATACT
jgi:transposase